VDVSGEVSAADDRTVETDAAEKARGLLELKGYYLKNKVSEIMSKITIQS